MTWTRLSDDFFDRPEILALSRGARLLHIEALVYCNRTLTDGQLPAKALRRLTDSPTPDEDVEELIAAGLWTPVDPWVTGDGWIVNWKDQEKAETVDKRRTDTRERQRKFREKMEAHRRGDHHLCLADRCKVKRSHDGGDHGNCTADWCNALLTQRVTPPLPDPPLPDPSQPEGAGTGAGREVRCERPGHSGTTRYCTQCSSERLAGDHALRVDPPTSVTSEAAS